MNAPSLPDDVVLSVRGLGKHYPIKSKGVFTRQTIIFKACQNISFDLKRGETLGIVGESGSGKTTLGRPPWAKPGSVAAMAASWTWPASARAN